MIIIVSGLVEKEVIYLESSVVVNDALCVWVGAAAEGEGVTCLTFRSSCCIFIRRVALTDVLPSPPITLSVDLSVHIFLFIKTEAASALIQPH